MGLDSMIQGHKECYRSKCSDCKCKNCSDFNECDSPDKKCYTCKFRGYTYTSAPQWYGTQESGTAASYNPCSDCWWTKQIQDKTYVGDSPCGTCLKSPYRVTCYNAYR